MTFNDNKINIIQDIQSHIEYELPNNIRNLSVIEIISILYEIDQPLFNEILYKPLNNTTISKIKYITNRHTNRLIEAGIESWRAQLVSFVYYENLNFL